GKDGGSQKERVRSVKALVADKSGQHHEAGANTGQTDQDVKENGHGQAENHGFLRSLSQPGAASKGFEKRHPTIHESAFRCCRHGKRPARICGSNAELRWGLRRRALEPKMAHSSSQNDRTETRRDEFSPPEFSGRAGGGDFHDAGGFSVVFAAAFRE